MKRCFLSLTLLLFFSALPVRGESLFGVPVTMQGQKDALLLYASLLSSSPSDNSSPKLVSLATEGYVGVGNYSYVMTLSAILQRELPFIRVQKLMGGSDQDKGKVGHIFGFPSDTFDFWFKVEAFSGYQEFEVKEFYQKASNSSVMISMANPPADYADPLLDYGINWLFLGDISHATDGYQAHYERYQNMIGLIPGGSQITVEENLRAYLDGEDLKFFLDDGSGGADRYNLQDTDVKPMFGLGKNSIGLLLSSAPQKPETLSADGAFEHAYAFMPGRLAEAFVQLFEGYESLRARKDNFHFYTGYFQSLYGKLLYIHSLAKMDTDADMIFMLPLTASDLENTGVLKSLSSIPAQAVHYWSGDSWTVFREPQLFNLSRRHIVIVNPFPLEREVYLQLLGLSGPVPIAGSTGDHSLYEVIAAGRLPFHEYMPHQGGVNRNLASIAEHAVLKEFFHAQGHDGRASALRSLRTNPEVISKYLEKIHRQYNATPFLVGLVRQTVVTDSTLWSSVADVTEQLAQGSLPDRQAVNPQEALAVGRAVTVLLLSMYERDELSTVELAQIKEKVDLYLGFLQQRYLSFSGMLSAIAENAFADFVEN
ncbi:MAG: hypothetical protein ACR2PT_07825 [Endozoicomonas sp.]